MSDAAIGKLISDIESLNVEVMGIKDSKLSSAKVKASKDLGKKGAEEKSKTKVANLEKKLIEIAAEIERIRDEIAKLIDAMQQAGEESKKGGNKTESGDSARDPRFDNKPKSTASKSSPEKKPNESGMAGGVRETLKNLRKKLDELRLKKKKGEGNESEEVRGFSSGGASEEDSLDAEIKMIEAAIATSQAKLLELQIATQQQNLTLKDVEESQGEVKDILTNAKQRGIGVEQPAAEKNEDNSRISLSFSSLEEAMGVARQIVGAYGALGLATSISTAHSGNKNMVTVTVEIPRELVGQDPLKLSAQDILDKIKGDGPEKSQDTQQKKGNNKQPWVERVGNGKTGLRLETGQVDKAGQVYEESWVQRVGEEHNSAMENSGLSESR